MESLPTNITSIPTTELLLLTPDPNNCSSWDQRWGAPYLAHLDAQLYQDFYAVWVSLMVKWWLNHFMKDESDSAWLLIIINSPLLPAAGM